MHIAIGRPPVGAIKDISVCSSAEKRSEDSTNKEKSTLISAVHYLTDTFISPAYSLYHYFIQPSKSKKKPEDTIIKYHFFKENIRDIFEKFNYSMPEIFFDGHCFALSACYIFHEILGSSEHQRQLLSTLSRDPAKGWVFDGIPYSTLSAAIVDAQKNEKDKLPGASTSYLLDIRPFLEQILAFQHPNYTIFENKISSQHIQKTAPYVLDDYLQAGFPVTSPYYTTATRSTGLQHLLTSLNKSMHKDTPKRFFHIHTGFHAIALKITQNNYEFFDQNMENYTKTIHHEQVECASKWMERFLMLKNDDEPIIFGIEEYFAPHSHPAQNEHSLEYLLECIPADCLHDPRQKNFQNVSQLYLAAKYSSPEFLTNLLKKGEFNISDINDPDNPMGLPVLHVAIRFCNAEAVKIFLERGADATKGCSFYNTALLLALNQKAPSPEIIKALLDGAPDTVNTPDTHGFYPLHVAIKSHNAEAVKILLERGADATKRFSFYSTALMLALNQEAPSTEIIKALLDSAPDTVNTPNTRGCYPLHVAIKSHNAEAVKILLERGADTTKAPYPYKTVWLLALHNGAPSPEIIKALLDKAPDIVNIPETSGHYPLHITVVMKSPVQIAVLDLLIRQENFNINQKTDSDHPKTALQLACLNGNCSVVEKLLTVKNIDIKCTESLPSPLEIACDNNNKEIIKLLEYKIAESRMNEPD